MPQKKNPDAAELVRGKSGRVIGDLVSLLVTLKGLPLSYNRDMQEDKEPVIDAVETAQACLDVLTGAIEGLRVNAAVTQRAASDPMLIATDLADHLVLKGVPFREAHGIVGGVVAHALAEGLALSALPRATLLSFHPALDVDPKEFFSVERSLEARVAPGAPSRVRVNEAISSARAELAGETP
jgi:argininosuccinate lyase